MRITKLLALATAAVVVAACNGAAPTSPNAIVAPDDAAAVVETQASKASADGSPCRDITEVNLRQVHSLSPGTVRIEAVYLIHDRPARCQVAPGWSSRPAGRLVRTKNPFIVGVTQTRPPTIVQVTAQAPNGVKGSVVLPWDR